MKRNLGLHSETDNSEIFLLKTGGKIEGRSSGRSLVTPSKNASFGCATVEAGMAETTTLTARTRFLGYGACAVAGCLWGTGFYFGRLALNEMSVEHMVLYRFFFACLGLLPVALLNRVRFTGSEIRILLVSSFFGVPVQFLIQFH